MLSRRNVGYQKRAAPSSPLSRPVDRYETRIQRLALLFSIVIALLPVLIGVLVWKVTAPVSPDQAVVTTQVRATTDAPAPAVTAQTVGSPSVTVRAHWQWQQQRRDGLIAVPAGTPVGGTQLIQVDQNGLWVGEFTEAEKRVNGTIASVVMAIFVSVLFIGLAREYGRRAIERRQNRYWTESLHRFFATHSD